MSPVPFIAPTFALSSAAPSAALDPNSGGQPATETSQHLLGTGGLVFAVVAIVSVAGYFYHGRRAANNIRTNNTWASLSSFLSSIRHRGTAATHTATTADRSVDLELSPQHVSMVYAKFFHPAFWNLVECHPATTSAPAIYVEDEVKEIPASEPKPYGMNSFLDMDDEGEDEDENDGPKRAQAKAHPVAKPRIEQAPPYDTSSPTNVNFSNEIIGTTVRPDAFLSVPEQYEDDLSETSFSDLDSETDLTCSPYDGILTTSPGLPDATCDTLPPDSASDLAYSPYDGITRIPPRPSDDSNLDSACLSSDNISTSSSDSESDLTCLPHDGSLEIPPSMSDDSEQDFICSPYDGILVSPSDSELNFACSPYDGISTTPSRSSCIPRRYGMADMGNIAETLKGTILEAGYGLTPAISRRTGFCDLSEPTGTVPVIPRGPLDDKATPLCDDIDIDVYDSREGLQKSSGGADSFVVSDEGLDLMRRLLEVLRDPRLDCGPRALSEDSDFEYREDEDDQGIVLPLTPMQNFDMTRRISLESAHFPPETDSEVSGEGFIYPSTPRSSSTTSLASAPDVHKGCIPSPFTTWFDEEAEVKSLTLSDSPPSLPCRAHVRTSRDIRVLVRGGVWLHYVACDVA